MLSDRDLARVLIGDEVGLGKTVEAGLITKNLLESQPDLRVLYLAPARLVRNVAEEFRRLQIDARKWVSGGDSDARLEGDRVVIASIHKSVYESNSKKLIEAGPWDLIIADECHHLSDWAEGGGSPNAGYRLVRDLLAGQRPGRGRLLLMSGTPHQGNQTRFENILELLRAENEEQSAVAGRVIYRTKESVRDWKGQPLFPKRDVRQPQLARLGAPWANWYDRIGDLYDGSASNASTSSGRARAGGWAKGQALQWAASSVDAGLGFLVRLAIRRLKWTLANPELETALAALRPYRGQSADEPLERLYERLIQQIGTIENQEDAEDLENLEPAWIPDEALLGELLQQGAELKYEHADAEKWRVMTQILREAGIEKVVLFCQPVETVAVVARYIEAEFGRPPAIIIGGQTEAERAHEIDRFRDPNGPQFIVSSRAGGEGLNLQISRRLLHLDIPWNPMDLEQRVGRVHRFGSRQTILVDTIVVPGTREADAYRIAREKLKLIAEQLDPSQFELLFSRVMNLVPPEELAGVFGLTQPWASGEEADNRIASIVQAGYEKLSRFTSEYSEGAKRIQGLATGSADWSDLRDYLRAGCGSEDAASGSKPIFNLKDNEIESSEAAVHTVNVFGRRFVCDETDGLPCYDEMGTALSRVGTNSKPLTAHLREQVQQTSEESLASVRFDFSKIHDDPAQVLCVVFLARQSFQFSGGSPQELSLDLRAVLINKDGESKVLPVELIGQTVRALATADKVTRPKLSVDFMQNLGGIVKAEIDQFRRDDRGESVHPTAIWPVSCFILTNN